MKRERRQPTRAELARITSRRPVVRKIPAPEKKPQGPGPDTPDRGNHQDRGEGEPMPNSRCSGIKADGGACRGMPIHGSEWCVAHHPDYQEERRKGGRKGGRRGGRGRPMAEVGELKELLATLTERVTGRAIGDEDYLSPAAGAVAAQLINTRLRAVELERKIKETEELEARLESLEGQTEEGQGGRRWGA